MALHGKDYAELAKVAISAVEAQKVVNIQSKGGKIEDAKIVEKVTTKNWFKNPRFYVIIGSLLVAGSTGDYVNIIPLVQEIGGMFF